MEIAGFVTGAACVWLAVRQNVLTFPFGIANTLIFLILFAQNGLYANALLQIAFLWLSIAGWYLWSTGGRLGNELSVRSADGRVWVAAGLGFAALTAVLVVVLTRWTDSSVALWDAATTASSVVAQLLLNRKRIITWLWWIATDVALVILYASQGLRLTALLYVILLLMCVIGLREWRASMGRQSEMVYE